LTEKRHTKTLPEKLTERKKGERERERERGREKR
jgi:hypothetical protein